MIFERKFYMNQDLFTREEILEFWESIGYKFTDHYGNIVQGRRGKLIHNYYTFNMRKLETVLTLNFEDVGEIEVTINVNTTGQTILKNEAKLWPMELEMFDYFIENVNFEDEKIQKYFKDVRKSQWGLILGIVAIGFVVLGVVIFILENQVFL